MTAAPSARRESGCCHELTASCPAGRAGACSRPIPLALLGVLLTACGFIGGVLVEKGQSTSSSASSGAPARLSPRASPPCAEGSSGAGASSGAGGGAGGGGLWRRLRAAPGRRAARRDRRPGRLSSRKHAVRDHRRRQHGQGHTSPARRVTKTVKADVGGIHPGETVTRHRRQRANGAVSAESIRVGASAGGRLAGSSAARHRQRRDALAAWRRRWRWRWRWRTRAVRQGWVAHRPHRSR